MDYTINQTKKHVDERGYLVEFLRRDELDLSTSPFGQIYFVTFERPDQVRGNHFHTRGYEWFGVAQGRLEVILEDVRTKERAQIFLYADDKTFSRLMVGPFVAHAFRNLTPTAVLIDYCSEQYNRADPDRNPYVLIQPPTLAEPEPDQSPVPTSSS